jgi:hypothetical protein
MLFWLGTAMAPSVSTGDASAPPTGVKVVQSAAHQVDNQSRDKGLATDDLSNLLAGPEDYCLDECPQPAAERKLDSDDWRPTTTTTTAAPASAARVPAPSTPQPSAPPPAPRPVEEWRSLVSSYFAPEHVDLALLIISCESGGDPNAQNRRSGAAGLFQQIPRYWEERAAAAGMPGASIFDPIANVAASAYLAYSDGWSHWAASASCWK